MKVYILFGLGFGDDEDVWEICDIYASQASADKAMADAAAEDDDDCPMQRKVEEFDVQV